MAKTIAINHIAKIEGHASFLGKLIDGKIKEAKMETEEGARLVEGVLLRRHFSDAPVITARICGICPVVHNLCSIKALEAALDIKVSPATVILRKLMKYGEIIHSHGLHFFWLSLPDFYKVKNDLDLVKKAPAETALIVKVREYGVDLVKIIGGRTVHPMASEVGGFKVLPNEQELQTLLDKNDSVMEAIWTLVKFFKKLKYPDLENKKEFISMVSDNEYPVYEGASLRSSNGETWTVNNFYKNIQERTYDESGRELVKRATFKDRAYMVGALARINNNYNLLNPEAKKVFKDLELHIPIHNSFYNILAQVVEVAHLIEESKKLIIEFQGLKNKNIKTDYKLQRGFGVAVVEAPRGMLFHAYELNKDGQIINCNIISPTDQLLNVIEKDLEALDLQGLDMKASKELASFLIRAYDPCISCATH